MYDFIAEIHVNLTKKLWIICCGKIQSKAVVISDHVILKCHITVFYFTVICSRKRFQVSEVKRARRMPHSVEGNIIFNIYNKIKILWCFEDDSYVVMKTPVSDSLYLHVNLITFIVKNVPLPAAHKTLVDYVMCCK